MQEDKRSLSLDLFDHSNNKICTLYDNNAEVAGQAYDITVSVERNGWKEITFSLPQSIHTENGYEDNFRIKYVREGYLIRLKTDAETDWYILSESRVTHNNFTRSVSITAGHVSQLLKHKNLGLEFSDEEGNNVGTAAMLLDTILENTGWSAGFVDEFYEKNGTDIKYRSMKASAKTGAFKLISNMCELFDAKPVYHGDTKTVDIIPINPFFEPKDGGPPRNPKKKDEYVSDVIELHYGTNVSNVTRTLNEENLVTKLYAYGSYGDKTNGYCGIDECTHNVYTLVADGEGANPGAECKIELTDAYGIHIVRYFIAGTPDEDYPITNVSVTDPEVSSNVNKISTVTWSDLDPASRMYVWDEARQCAYLLYENMQGEAVEAVFTEDESMRTEKQNWFSFLMSYEYYNSIGLFTNDMLQDTAKYQQNGPAYLKEINEKSTEYSEGYIDLTETIGAVDFCKLDCRIEKNNGEHVRLVLNTSEYPKGIVYRTDYTKKEDKQFKWRVADELKANGDPVHDVASIVYIVYEETANRPLMFEKAYLKNIDDEDDPHTLTLWLTSEKSKYVNQRYRVYLFAQHNVNGYLGAYEAADEATQIAIASTTKNVTVNHPIFFEKDRPSSSINVTNGYAWWWKWYEGTDTPSELYFCWNDKGDEVWQQVTVDAGEPGYTENKYWYSWKKSKLWRYDDGGWAEKNVSAADKRITALFGAVYAACQTRDKYYKGLYQKYIYTAAEALPQGNYAFDNGYGGWWVFTTDAALSEGDTLTYDTTISTVTEKIDEAETVIETKACRFDSVYYHSSNIADGAVYENGDIDPETGGEIEGTKYRSGYMIAYRNTVYTLNGYNGYADLYYYDENRRYLGCDEHVFCHGGQIVTPDAMRRQTETGELEVGGTKYIRTVTEADISGIIVIATPDYDRKIIAGHDETYLILDGLTTDGRLKGIVTLTKEFADKADVVYETLLTQLKQAQDSYKELETNTIDRLGDLYREGYWQKDDYVDGDEKKLYDDALENLEKISKPEVSYNIEYHDLYNVNPGNERNTSFDGIPYIMWPDISSESAVHLIDPDIAVNTWAFVDKIDKCYDAPWKTKIKINTNLSTIAQHSFTDVMTHIAEVSSQVKGRMTLYERAAAITDSGELAAERLEGKIDANRLQITGASSTWYTDDKGNMVFESADGNSAMMITGNGFSLASDRNTDGDWNWRTFGTGEGFSADEIVTGYLSAERILAGSIATAHLSADVGQELDITANKSLRLIVSNLLADTQSRINEAILNITPEEIVQKITSTEVFATNEQLSQIEQDSMSGIVTQYYVSTSDEEPSGGEWTDVPPEWDDSKYLWTRSIITKLDGTETVTDPVLDKSWKAIRDLQVGGRNYIEYSSDLIWENHHRLIQLYPDTDDPEYEPVSDTSRTDLDILKE